MVMVLSPIKQHIQLALATWSLAVGDFNNDTHLDIVVANYGDNNIGVLLGYGDGSFANQTTYSTGILVHGLLLWVISITTLIWISLLPIRATTIIQVFFLDMVMVLSPIKQHIQLALFHNLLL